ncbi:uncharacterized protein IL334_000689 [Kwoniella shivajii]|uniref:DUF4211 domain-containing protein n=1 Tax=Kwoniella shivajii TaxID=564305 RepID=A0ABZ1CQV4_9TREE|nr:hypothetical protein IL334_000689 [Kwoniella shivajii]
MPSRQSTLFSHFSPSQNDAGPSGQRSTPRRTRNPQPLLDPSESEGSEGMDGIKMRDNKLDVNKLPITQRRTLKKTIVDSDDDSREQEGEEDDTIRNKKRRRGQMVVELPRTSLASPTIRDRKKRGHRDDAEYSEPDADGPSVPLDWYNSPDRTPPDYFEIQKRKVKEKRQLKQQLEDEREKQREDDKIDSEIEVFPSPPSPRNNKRKLGRTGHKNDSRIVIDGSSGEISKSNENSNNKGKGKEKEKADDEIIPIDAPPKPTPRYGRATQQPSFTYFLPTKPAGRPKLNLQRTKSEVIVEIPRLSQEDKQSYTYIKPSQSSQPSRSDLSTKSKEDRVPESKASSSESIVKPAVEEPNDPTPSHSLPPILEVELSNKDLGLLTDSEQNHKEAFASTREPPLAVQSSQRKSSSPMNQPSPLKQTSTLKQPSPPKPPSTGPVTSSYTRPSPAISMPPLKRRALSPSPALSSGSSIAVVVPTKRKDKGKQKAVSESESEDSMPIRRFRKATPLSVKSSKKKVTLPEKKRQGKLKSKALDPDEDAGAETENEENMLDDLKMDEPERFKSKTRLRKRPQETAAQRSIRKLKNRREGLVESSTSESSEGTFDDSSDGSASDHDEEDFIVPDDARTKRVQLPHEFSVDSAQTPEFKFKVVFHYLVLLVMRGKKAFPLDRESQEYFVPQLRQFRDRMVGYRQLRVRSQIWRTNFVKAMEKYPIFDVEELMNAEPGCDACHMGGRMSRFRVNLEGEQYDQETHQPLDSSDEEDEPEDSDDSEASERKRRKLPRSLLMGRFCRQRAQVYHDMVHWEDELYHRIRNYYHDLLRAKYKPVQSDSEASSSDTDEDEDPYEVKERRANRKQRRLNTASRVERLRKKKLPDDPKDVDEVTEWMDKMGYQNKDFRWIETMIEKSGRLEHDKQKDE